MGWDSRRKGLPSRPPTFSAKGQPAALSFAVPPSLPLNKRRESHQDGLGGPLPPPYNCPSSPGPPPDSHSTRSLPAPAPKASLLRWHQNTVSGMGTFFECFRETLRGCQQVQLKTGLGRPPRQRVRAPYNPLGCRHSDGEQVSAAESGGGGGSARNSGGSGAATPKPEPRGSRGVHKADRTQFQTVVSERPWSRAGNKEGHVGNGTQEVRGHARQASQELQR